MKILGLTMGRSLQVFLQLHKRLQAADPAIGEPALYVSDSQNYQDALREFPVLSGLEVLKEWELTRLGEGAKPNAERLASYQAAAGGSLWHAVMADRRLFFGPLSKAKQDYRSQYSEEELLTILDRALVAIDHFIDRTAPDAAISFGSATFGDYLFEVLLKQKGIRFWQLKATKIGNNVAMLDAGIDLPGNVAARFRSGEPFPAETRQAAEHYIASVEQRGVKYEGAILFSRERMLRRLRQAPRRLLGAARREVWKRRDPVLRADPHLPPPFRSAWLTEVVQPLRTFMLGRRLPLLSAAETESVGDFAFYPMHFEPEVSLQVFGRPFQNQIELVRTLALSLPVGVRLLVKEHPRSLGFRKESYYRNLLAIPNTRLVDPFVPTVDIVRRAKLVCVVSGSVGLEAVVLGKPLLVFGRALYRLLPATMVREAANLNTLDREIADFLNSYSNNREAIVRYLSTLISLSAPVDLYTGMLQKEERYREKDGSAQEDGYERLAQMAIANLRHEC